MVKCPAYPVGWLFWRELATLHLPLKIKIEVAHDPEANVFVASTDAFLPYATFVCEADTVEKLHKEVALMLADTFESVIGKNTAARTSKCSRIQLVLA